MTKLKVRAQKAFQSKIESPAVLEFGWRVEPKHQPLNTPKTLNPTQNQPVKVIGSWV